MLMNTRRPRILTPLPCTLRVGPGQQQVISKPASLDELSDDVHALLESLEPAGIERQDNAVVITGTRNGEDILVTASFFVAQPTDTWAAAEGGPRLGWTAWSGVIIDEAAGTVRSQGRGQPQTPNGHHWLLESSVRDSL
jgi:hypothetical protein